MDVAQLAVIAIGLCLVALGIYGAAPYFFARHRLRRSASLRRPTPEVFSSRDPSPRLRREVYARPAVEPAVPAYAEAAPIAPPPPPAPRATLPPLVDEMEVLSYEVDALRRQVGAMRAIQQRVRRKSRLPGAVLPSSLQKRFVEMRRQAHGGLALAGPATGRIRSRRVA